MIKSSPLKGKSIGIRKLGVRLLTCLVLFLSGITVGMKIGRDGCEKSDVVVRGKVEVSDDDVKNASVKGREELEKCDFYVDVSGAVISPGVYCFKTGELYVNAIEKAGDFNKKAYGYKYISRKINLAAELVPNQKIYVPFEEDLECTLQSFIPSVESITENTETGPFIPSGGVDKSLGCISINNASLEELQLLSGVGEVTAEKIIIDRPYAKLEDLLEVPGVGEVTFENFQDQICL